MAADKRQLWEMYTRSGKQFMRLRNWREARRMFEAALQVAGLFEEADPRQGVAMINLAHVHQASRKWSEAEDLLNRALDAAVRAHGRQHPDAAVVLANMAGLAHAQGRDDEAERLYREAAEILRRTLGPGNAGLARVLAGHAAVLRKLGRDAEADQVEAGSHGPDTDATAESP